MAAGPRLLSYNIRFGGRGRERLLAQAIRAADPDVVVLQEAYDPEVVAALSRATGLASWSAQPGHSLAYLSRLPVDHHAWHYGRGAKHPFLELVLSGGAVRVFGLHLRAVFSRWTERLRAREIGSLLAAIEAHRGGFHVLTGDFNALSPEAMVDLRRLPIGLQVLAWLSGRQVQRYAIHHVLEQGYVDGFRALHPEADGYTFPTADAHVRLDYLFVPEAHAPRVAACEVVREPADLMRIASDHFPLLSVLQM
jgi:exodeoxyribonuclease-3